MSVGVGDRLPDLTLLDPAGAPVSLGTFASEDTLLIFLRHLA